MNRLMWTPFHYYFATQWSLALVPLWQNLTNVMLCGNTKLRWLHIQYKIEYYYKEACLVRSDFHNRSKKSISAMDRSDVGNPCAHWTGTNAAIIRYIIGTLCFHTIIIEYEHVAILQIHAKYVVPRSSHHTWLNITWPSFCSHFEIHFLVRKLVYFD